PVVRLVAAILPILGAAALGVPVALSASSPAPPSASTAVVTYESRTALHRALRRYPARIVRRLPDVRSVEVRPSDPRRFAAGVARLSGIVSVETPEPRFSASEPGLTAMYSAGVPYQWQYTATRADTVPEAVLRAASGVKIAVIDTGGDLTAPDLAAKAPETYNIFNGSTDVRDFHGHGTFVASIAGGSVSNAEGIAGFGGDAQLLLIQTGRADGSFTDVDEADAIVYAVNHGAKVINLSIGGTETSSVERAALEYAGANGVLVVAAAGNEFAAGNPIAYPAALLQPVGSKGRGGLGLSVGASTKAGRRASFSNTGSWISLAAPGEDVLGAVSSYSRARSWPRYGLPGSTLGLYGFSSGTSFAAPQVAGAAALVWAANPTLTRDQVAWILKRSASADGHWTKGLGYGILDVGRAVATAQNGGQVVPPARAFSSLRVVGRLRRQVRQTRIRVRAKLNSRLAAISPAGRRVSLQIRRNGKWYRVARARTKASGRVLLKARLRPGRYVMRVKYAGAPELTSASSGRLLVRIKS
ncbi:MAG: S8 family serine peptidase, partial [Actinomycetota bacterium]|nr:S8 family serine peptidase [Actinomycetota bacterium]